MIKSNRQDSFFYICDKCKLTCCLGARPPLTSERISQISGYMRVEGISIENPFKKSAYSFPRETSEGYCIFYDSNTKKCGIHFSKPETCVAGPITFDISIVEGKIRWYLKSENICCLAGELFRNKDRLKKHLDSAKREINAVIYSLSKKELLAILEIEEPETFEIDEDPLNLKILSKLR